MTRAVVPQIDLLLLATGACGGAAGTATCTDAAADGGAADLPAVELTAGGEGLRPTLTLAAALDTSAGTRCSRRW